MKLFARLSLRYSRRREQHSGAGVISVQMQHHPQPGLVDLTKDQAGRLSKAYKLSDDTEILKAMDIEIFERKIIGQELEEKLALLYGTSNRDLWVGANVIMVKFHDGKRMS